MSYAEFAESDVSSLTLLGLKVVSMLGLVAMETGLGKSNDRIRVNNLTLINFVIKWVGPCHEQTLTLYMMALQVCMCVHACGI